MSDEVFDVAALTGAQIDALREAFIKRERDIEGKARMDQESREEERRRKLLALALHPWFSAPQWVSPHGSFDGARAEKAGQGQWWREPASVSDWQRTVELRADCKGVHLTCRIQPFLTAQTPDEAVQKFASYLRELAADLFKTADSMEAAKTTEQRKK